MKFVKIESIEEIDETSDVYDIEVEDNHNFFANGILVHNCLAGPFSFETLNLCRQYEFERLNASLLDDRDLLDRCVAAIGNVHDKLADAVGIENAYLEIQFNKLGGQHLVNRALIEFARRNGLTHQLLVTCDSHYPRPEAWRTREVYKKLGWMRKEIDPNSLPKSRDDLKCELYPKNASQVWDEYLLHREANPWYNDTEVKEAIERSYDVAHEVIGDVKFDTSYKYPMSVVPKDTTALSYLTKLAIAGLKKKNLHTKKEYVDRLKHELEIIKRMDNAAYFVTLARMLELAREVCLLGVARGSGGGSLVCYVTGITDLDPIKYKCRFDRFLNPYRVGAPDIDCLRSDHLIVMSDNSLKPLSEIEVGDSIFDHLFIPRKVTFVQHRSQRDDEICFELLIKKQGTFGTVVGNEKHRLLLNDMTNKFMDQLVVGDTLLGGGRIVNKRTIQACSLTDITVDTSSTFYVIPFDVVEIETNQRQCLIHVDTYLDNELPGDFNRCDYYETWIR